MGDEYLVILDGKELSRGKLTAVGVGSQRRLSFSAGGKHLFYFETDTSSGGYRVVMDGKPGPWSHGLPEVVVTARMAPTTHTPARRMTPLRPSGAWWTAGR